MGASAVSSGNPPPASHAPPLPRDNDDSHHAPISQDVPISGGTLTPDDETPSADKDNLPSEELIVEKTPSDKALIAEAADEETLKEETFVEKTLKEETPILETLKEETSVVETQPLGNPFDENLNGGLQNLSLIEKSSSPEKEHTLLKEEGFAVEDGWGSDGYDQQPYAAVNTISYNDNNDGWNDDINPDSISYFNEENVEYGSKEGEDNALSADGREFFRHPLRPDAEDCAFYLRTGSCKFGSNCKFNHPIKKKRQDFKEKTNDREESQERQTGRVECKYYLSSGGCKYGKACRYNHSRGRPFAAPVVEFNFLGLPIRPGEKECPYYMRTGSCKYETNCRFNHPDPTTGSDTPSGYGNGRSSGSLGPSQPSATSWSSSPSKLLNETSPLVPMMYSTNQRVLPRNPEWNGYQKAPVYAPERNIQTPSAFANTRHQTQLQGEEFPERPGQPECSFFVKTGDCKFRSNCKFHHPKNRVPKSSFCAVTDKGLPLRPDQNICVHYSRYGICKFGPNCKFDHPINIGSSTSAVSGLEMPFGNSATSRESLIQQSV